MSKAMSTVTTVRTPPSLCEKNTQDCERTSTAREQRFSDASVLAAVFDGTVRQPGLD